MPRPDAAKPTDAQGKKPEPTPDILRQGFRFALSLTHDRPAAEDLLHDACVSVLNAKGPTTAPYLITTIRNRFIDLRRRDLIAPTESLDSGPRPTIDREDEFWNDPFNAIEMKSALQGALGLLRPEERAVLVLSAVEGYSAREIGEMLDAPRGTILSLMHRARIKMRRWLTDNPDQEQR